MPAGKNNVAKCWYLLVLIIAMGLCGISDVVNAQLSLVQQAPNAIERINAAYKIVWLRKTTDTARPTRVLDSIRKWATETGDQQLYNYAESFDIYRRSQAIANDSLRLAYINKRFDPLLKYNDRAMLGHYHFIMSSAYDLTRHPEQATYHFVNAENIFNDLGIANLPLAPEIAEDLGSVYLQFENYATAVRYYTFAYEHSFAPEIKHRFLLNNMGVAYIKMKDYPKALQAFEKLMNLEKDKTDLIYFGIASGNYGNVLRLQQRYHEALPYLYTDVAINEEREPNNSAISCLYIAHCLLHLDSTQKAGIYLGLARRLQHDSLSSSYRVHYFETHALYFKKTGDDAKATRYQDTLLRVKDSLRYLFDNRVLMANSLIAKEEKLLAQQKEAELKVKNIRLIRNFSLAILLLAFGVTLLFFYQKQQRQKRLAQERQREADEQLRRANEQLAHYLDNIREKNALIEKIEAQLQQPAPQPQTEGQAPPAEAPLPGLTELQLEQLYQSVIMTEDEWTAFKQVFEQVWPGFLQQLNHTYPGLTQSEERVLTLHKLGLESKDMAKMLGISMESLRKSRYRLRKKFPALLEDEEFKDVMMRVN